MVTCIAKKIQLITNLLHFILKGIFCQMYNNCTLTRLEDVGYNNYGRDWLAFKEGRKKMQAMKIVNASLHNDRGTYTVRGRVFDPETGKTRNRSKSTGLKVKDNTKRKAEAVMRDIIEQWTFEANTVPIKTDDLFIRYVLQWYNKAGESGIKSNTLKSYKDYIDKWIRPELGNIPITIMSCRDIDNFYKKYLKKNKVTSARKVNVVLRGAFREAIRDGVINENLADSDHRDFPKAEKYKGNFYNKEQAFTLLEKAKKIGEPIYSAIILAIFYGLRKSEILGLRWKDIDFSAKTLTVNNTVTQNGALRVEQEKTKTAKSNRTIALQELTVQYLKELKKKQEQAGIKDDKVVSWLNAKKDVRPDYIYSKTKKIMEACGLPVIRFHDLRHTAASLLVTKITPKQLQDFLGHEHVDTTLNIYAHTLDEDKIKTAEAMNSIVENYGFVF